MSLGHEYDMLLLTPRAPPSDDEVTPRQPRLARHDASNATPTLREPGAARHSPPISYGQLLVRGPWLGTCLA